MSLSGPSHGARVWRLGRVSHILSFRSLGVVSLFIFPTGPTALDSEPRGRRYAKNTGHDRNRLYLRAIHLPGEPMVAQQFRTGEGYRETNPILVPIVGPRNATRGGVNGSQ